jgi:hypothetical protein
MRGTYQHYGTRETSPEVSFFIPLPIPFIVKNFKNAALWWPSATQRSGFVINE